MRSLSGYKLFSLFLDGYLQLSECMENPEAEEEVIPESSDNLDEIRKVLAGKSCIIHDMSLFESEIKKNIDARISEDMLISREELFVLIDKLIRYALVWGEFSKPLCRLIYFQLYLLDISPFEEEAQAFDYLNGRLQEFDRDSVGWMATRCLDRECNCKSLEITTKEHRERIIARQNQRTRKLSKNFLESRDRIDEEEEIFERLDKQKLAETKNMSQ